MPRLNTQGVRFTEQGLVVYLIIREKGGLVVRFAEVRVPWEHFDDSDAWALYSRYVRCSLPAECLPSTSSANARLKLSDLAEAYQVIRNAAEKES